jgi:hypothetical protein
VNHTLAVVLSDRTSIAWLVIALPFPAASPASFLFAESPRTCGDAQPHHISSLRHRALSPGQGKPLASMKAAPEVPWVNASAKANERGYLGCRGAPLQVLHRRRVLEGAACLALLLCAPTAPRAQHPYRRQHRQQQQASQQCPNQWGRQRCPHVLRIQPSSCNSSFTLSALLL